MEQDLVEGTIAPRSLNNSTFTLYLRGMGTCVAFPEVQRVSKKVTCGSPVEGVVEY